MTSRLGVALATLAVTGGWHSGPALPVARTEVAAARSGSAIVVAGGFLVDGSSTARVDVYDPAKGAWRRGPDLPQPLNHAAAATLKGDAVVVGGFASGGRPTTTAVRLDGDRWQALPPLPRPRAAAAAVALKGRLYVLGGVTTNGLAKVALVYDPPHHRWAQLPGIAPRQHLAAAAARGRIYAIAGRAAGDDTNVATVQSWAPGEKRWRTEKPVPEARGGTGAATVDGTIVSAGSEAPQGTSGAVYGLDTHRGTWRRLPDLPTPRHGLGVVAYGREVFVIGGGPQPGLTVTAANESLTFS
jgi:non-specific serine/threonine protein kinase